MNTIMHKLARWMAFLGGTVLLCLVAITCISVLGRILNTVGHYPFVKENIAFLSNLLTKAGPIVGDFELVEAGVAFAIMAFLPWCQLNRAHAAVELFTGFLPKTPNRLLAMFWEILFAAVMVIITWRIYVGTTDKMRYGETTFMLQYPVWWGYAACTIAAGVACIIAIYSAWLHTKDFFDPKQGTDVDKQEIAG
ncbi:MAG: TRAP transporter small permease [Pseudomonadota bacterium]